MLVTLIKDLLSCQVLQNASDTLADPDVINELILLWLDETSEDEYLDLEPRECVSLLDNFARNDLVKPKIVSDLK